MDEAPKFETRAFDVELRVEQRHRGAPPTIVGHAAVFNSLSEDLGGFREQINPGAFTRTLREGGPVYALWNHDPNFVIASTRNGSLRLSEDKAGLRAEMDPIDTPTIRDLVVKPIQDGLITKMSFGFSVPAGGAEMASDKNLGPVRTLRDVDLFDVSPVTFPAYPNTDVAARALWIARRAASVDPDLAAMLAQMDRLMDQMMAMCGMGENAMPPKETSSHDPRGAQERDAEDAKVAGAIAAAVRDRELTLRKKRTP